MKSNKPRPPAAPRRAASSPPARRPSPGAGHRAAPSAGPAPKPQTARPQEPLSDDELQELQALLDAIPAPLESLDVSMLDGYLMGVLLQPKAVTFADWAPFVLDADGRPAPKSFDGERLFDLIRRRHRELNHAIVERQWFDPWVFELDEEAEPSEVVYAWVAGFALATEVFPELMREDAASLLEPLAQLYMHLDPDDLEDADELLEEIETLEPSETVAEAVECLVRSSLLLADITRPLRSTEPARPARPGASRPGGARSHGPAGGKAGPRGPKTPPRERH